MQKGKKHEQAAPLFDKVVFDKVKEKKRQTYTIIRLDFNQNHLKIFENSFIFFEGYFQVKKGLGGNVRIILSGGAPLATHIETFFRVVSCAHVLQGYGMSSLYLHFHKIKQVELKYHTFLFAGLTETCGGTFVTLPNELSMLGTVGPPVPNVDVCLESVPEMGYDSHASTPRGEVCIKGDTLFSGYYKRDDLTAEVLVDGWFHTGTT